jgi:hypothetical protein
MYGIPLNEQQRKEGCLMMSILLILFIIGLIFLYHVVNNQKSNYATERLPNRTVK